MQAGCNSSDTPNLPYVCGPNSLLNHQVSRSHSPCAWLALCLLRWLLIAAQLPILLLLTTTINALILQCFNMTATEIALFPSIEFVLGSDPAAPDVTLVYPPQKYLRNAFYCNTSTEVRCEPQVVQCLGIARSSPRTSSY